MKTEWRRFAPVGLYLALVAALAAAVLYILQREWNLPLQISLGLMVLGLALYALLDPNRVRVAVTGRQARYGSNALVLILAIAGILVVINFLVYKNPKRWDLTEDQEHTLMQESIDTLKALPESVQALAFYPSGVSTESAQQVLEDYKFYSDGKFDYKFIDPIADPVAAQEANVPLEAGGTIVLRMGDRQEKVTIASENEMTGAMVRLLSQKVSIYFLTGHDEYSPDETGDQSFSQAKKTLQSKNYTVQTLNLLANHTIPEDAQVIVIAGPRKPLSQEEIDVIGGFLNSGGALVVMEEPTLLTDYGDAADPLAEYLLTNWGVNLRNDVILDVSSQQPYQAFAAQYSSGHVITEKLQRLGTAFPTARSVKAETTAGVTVEELIFTSQQSWAETDLAQLASGGQPQPDEGLDQIGNIPLAVAAERSDSGGRVVVFGDADFAIDANFAFLGNGDLLINSIDWAAEQENLINLTPKTPTQRIFLQPQTVTKGLILLGSVFVPSVLVLLSGITVAVQRRRRG